jgi:protoporphyrinogen oxidase
VNFRFQVIDNSCTILDKLSAKAWGNYSFSGGNDYINFKKGYSSLIRAIVEELPTGTLFLNSPVTKVKWQQNISMQVQGDTVVDDACKKLAGDHMKNNFNADLHRVAVPQAHYNGTDSKVLKTVGEPPVMVLCSNGAVYTAEHVIVTCSLGCLKDSCKTMFEPELPNSMIQVSESAPM